MRLQCGCGSDEDCGWSCKGKWCGDKGVCGCGLVSWEVMHSGWGKLGGERVEVVEDKGRERFAQMRGSAVSVWEINSVPYSLFL